MSRRNQDLVSRVRFEVDSRMANATMQALQTHAEKLNQQVAEVNASIKALGDVPDDNPALLEYRKQLRRLNSDLKDVNTTMKDYTRGVKAAGELYRHYAMGNIEDMSIKAIRAGVNGMKKRYDNLKAGGDPGDAEEMRLIEAITNEADVVVKRFKTDYQHVVEEIARGGTVTEQTLKRTRDGLADLMQTAETEAEKNELTNYWQKVGAAIEAVAVENRRLRGEVADREEAMRIAYATDHDGSQQAIHDAEARADAARHENDELRQRLDLKQQQRRELEQEMDINSMQVRSLMDRRDELKAQEKEDRAIRNQRVDDANKELNAARRAAKTQQQAYDEQKQTVEKLRTEVQGLTDDIRKMGEVKAEPKIDTSELEAKLAEAKRVLGNASAYEKLAQAKLDGMRSVLTEQGTLLDSKQAELRKFTDATYDLQSRRDELDFAIEPFSRKGRSSGRYHFDIHDVEQQRVAVEKLDEAFRRLADDDYFKNASLARKYELLGTSAFGYSDAEQQFGSYERAIRSLGVAAEESGAKFRLLFQGAGVDKSFQGVEFLDGYVSRRKEIAQLNAEIKKALGDTNIDELAREVDHIAGSYNKLAGEVQEQEQEVARWGKLRQEYADNAAAAERELAAAQQQSAQSSEQLAQKQEQLSQKTSELNQQQDKLNGMVDETVTANQRLARAEQEQTDARNAQAEAKKHEGEAVKKVEDELRGLTDEQLKNAQAYSHLTEEINADTAAMQRNITTEQEATREADRLRSGSIDKMEQALARLRESNRKLDPTIDKEEWERGERAIGQLTLRLEELKKQSAELRREPVLDMMTQRMDQLGTLSRDALTETKKFWEQMVDGAKKGSTELADYEQHLKSIALEEQARVREQGREAFAFFQREDYRHTNAADTEEQRKALVAYRDALPADATDHIEAINALLEKQAQFVKEAAGEWMSLEKAMELASKAGTDQFAGSAKDIQLATQSLERQRDTIIATIREKRNLGRATKTEEDQLADLTKKLRSLKFEQDNVNMSQEKMRTLIETPANAVNLDELRAAIKRADGQLRQMQQSLGENSSEYKRFAEQVRNAKNVMKEMEGQAKASATAWEKAFSRLKTYVVMYMGFNEVWQKVSNTARDLMDLSDRMGEVRKTTGFTADEVGRLSDNLTKLDTRTNLTGLMEFSSLAGSVGLKTQEAVQGFTEAANMLSVSLPELGKEASRTLMKIADATGDLEKNSGDVRETLERVGSTVIALRANSAAAAGPITDFVSRVGAVGAQAGISIDQIAALGATVDALGGRVEMSATALSRMIPAIRNNTFEVAQAIGMTEKQLKQMSGIDQMVAVFKALNNSVKNFDMTTEEGMNAAADAVEGMLGRSVSMQDVMKQLNQQGARAGIVFGLLSQNVDTLEKQLKIATDAYRDNTALMEEYNKMNETTAAKWERLKNQFEEAFVSDSIQRGLGALIDMLRGLVDFITGNVTGVLQGLHTAFLMLAAAATVYRMELGKMIFVESLSGLSNLKKALVGVKDTILLTAMYTKDYIALKWKLVFAHSAEEKAAIKAKIATLGLNKALTANVWMAVVAAIGMLLLKLYQFNKATREAAEDVGRFNQKVSDEQKALNKLFEPLNKSNMAQEERLKLINEINSKYGKYLGYMLSETSTAIQLADAHALIAKRIKEEAYQRRLAEQESKVRESYESELNSQYGTIISRVRSGRRGEADVTEIADILKAVVTNNISKYNKQQGFISPYGDDDYWIDPKMKELIDNTLTRLNVDGKVWGENLLKIKDAVYRYAQSYGNYYGELMRKTGDIRSDLRTINTSIKTDLTNNLNGLVGRIINFGKKMQTPSPVPAPAPGRPAALTPVWQQGNNGSTGWGGFPWNPKVQHSEAVQMPAPGWKPQVNEKNLDEVRQFVEDQDNLRNFLKDNAENISEQSRATAEAYLVSENELKRLRKLLPKENGDTNPNPYGDYNKVTSPYSQWNGDDLVARRKEMLERVRALANGADVQKVLSEDARFISEAVRKNIKTTEQAIEWYNAERLKIQEALYNKHLTPTGDWLDPKKGAGNWRKQLQTDFDNYLRILDAYYTERKAHIEKAQAEEGLSEAEAQRLTVENETVWRKHRMELQQIYLGKSADIAEEERQRIYDILAEQDEDSADMVEKQIAISINKLHLLAQKSEVEARKIETKLVKDIATDHYKQQNAVSKQMEAIEKIISEERPFDGITKNLRDNLSTMGVLFADFDKKRREAIERGEQPEDDMAERAKQMAKRLSVVLDGVPDAYRMTFDQLKEVMIKEGFGEWAKAIEGDEKLKLAMMAQIRKTYDQVQEAIRKEAALIKKHADNLWNDALTPDGKSMKNQFEAVISQLGLQADQVKRANSLIGAGVASDRVADRLVIQQMKVQLAMERARFDLMRKIGNERIEQEKAVEQSLIRQEKFEEAKRKHADIENMQKSLGLAISEEQKKVDEQRVAIQNQLEESQNRLYTELRSWADLLSSSLQGVFEASHAGDAEYYNERAKLNLTGKGGPGAGTYVVIDDAGTSDATAHLEYLDERQALERQHEIEIQNAQAEAWRKLMDDLNMKMSEQITDWLNAAAQNASVDANTDATLANTEAIVGLTSAMGGKVDTSLASGLGYEPSGNEPNPTIERIGYEAEQQVTQTSTTESAPSVFLDPNNVGLIWEQQAEAAELSAERQVGAIDKVKVALDDQFHKQEKGSKESSQKMAASTQSTFAKMTQAANLYGIAYQTMSNDNLSASQKFQMFALQAAGNAAIAMLTTDMASVSAKHTMQLPGILGKLLGEMPYPAAIATFAAVTALLGGLMGLAMSKVAKSKGEIAQVTGASVGAGRLATGMLTYAEGNVNELTDPASLTPGRQYNVDGADGKTYRARYMGKGAKTHITNGAEFHLVGEAGREAIIDAKTTRLLQMNETGIWRDIQTLYNGGSISGLSTRRRRGGVRAFADGNIGEFEDALGGEAPSTGADGMGMEQMLTALDRNSAIQEALLERLNQPIYAQNILYGPDGLPNIINKLNKEAQRHGEKYL